VNIPKPVFNRETHFSTADIKAISYASHQLTVLVLCMYIRVIL